MRRGATAVQEQVLEAGLGAEEEEEGRRLGERGVGGWVGGESAQLASERDRPQLVLDDQRKITF